MFRVLTSLVSPSGRNGKLSAFIFHRVLAVPDPSMPDEPDAEYFGKVLDWIGAQFQVLDPLEACRRLTAGKMPARAAVITFDDGYRDNFEVALPLLQSRQLPAAFFVASAFNDGSAMFNDRINFAVRDSTRRELDLDWLPGGPVRIDSRSAKLTAVARLISAIKYESLGMREERVAEVVDAAGADAPRGLMMTSAQLQQLSSAGMTIGGHTRRHPILRVSPDEEARNEIVGGRRDLVEITGAEVKLFAYPNGRRGQDYDAVHVDMVRQAGYEFAFCTHPGASTRRTSPLELRRFTPWGRQRAAFSFRALANLVGTEAAQDGPLVLGSR